MKCPNARCTRTIAVEATSCICGWKASAAPVERSPEQYVEPKRCAPTMQQREILRKFAAGHKKAGPWWTIANVRNQAQVNFIITQANHFGALSPAGRFHSECVDAGVIADCKFVPANMRTKVLREPGEDSPDDWREDESYLLATQA